MALPDSFVALTTIEDVLSGNVSMDFTAGGGPGAPGSEFFRGSLWTEGGETGSPSLTPHSTEEPYGTDPWGTTTNYFREYAVTNYTAGGGASGTLTTPTLTPAAEGLTWADTAGALTWSGLTGSENAGVSGILLSHYASSAYTRPVCFLNFGAAFSYTSGSFTVTWPTGGIWFLPAAVTS